MRFYTLKNPVGCLWYYVFGKERLGLNGNKTHNIDFLPIGEVSLFVNDFVPPDR